jgi:hypothetical protein
LSPAPEGARARGRWWLRSLIVLLAVDRQTNSEMAVELAIHRNLAGKWRTRSLEHRLDGLSEEPRAGRSRTITDAHVEQLVITTLEPEPRRHDALVDQIDRQRGRADPAGGAADLEGVRTAPSGPTRKGT